MIDKALSEARAGQTPRSSTGKLLYGVNARRRRQARFLADMRIAARIINTHLANPKGRESA
jgi:hypothetical protein